ncbi:MAG: lipopolysaccharide biosynthesis [Xanthobacteraceae bacterium]|nr:lipopolysaccharide biosynthesis [Xanthobacteraceae bacterium]
MAVAAQSGRMSEAEGELDLRALGRAILSRKWTILIPTFLVAVFAIAAVQLATPKYRAESRVLFDGRENIFLRLDADKQLDRGPVDEQAVTSQVQLVLSRELANEVIKKLKLAELPEFDPVLNGVSLFKTVLAFVGIGKDPLRMTPEERVLAAYYERLNVFPVEKSRVIGIEFQSESPALAARVANAIAEGYIGLQQTNKQEQARSASEWLLVKIDEMRKAVGDAEGKVEAFRSKSNLFVGTNNTTLSTQGLSELNTQLAAARARKTDSEARAKMARDLLKSGQPIDSLDVLNSENIRRLAEQRNAIRAQLAEQSSTLLDGHPRIKELRAQISDLDGAMKQEVGRIVHGIENDARIAADSLEKLSANLDVLKRQTASTGEQDVQLRALERDAKSQRDLLESYLAKYREATSRDTIESAPADARVISRATVSNIPSFPKKLPVVLIATLTTLVLMVGFVATRELLYGSYFQSFGTAPVARAAPAPTEAPKLSGAIARDGHPALGVAISAIDDIARALRRDGEGGRRVVLVGATKPVGTALPALTLARALAKEARVVLVELAPGSGDLVAILAEPTTPTLADLVRGTVSFGDILTRDRLSRVHMVSVGREIEDAALVLGSPQLVTVLDALASTYEHVVIDAGALSQVPLDRLSQLAACAVLVAGDAADASAAAGRRQLLAAGFAEVAVLLNTSNVLNVDAARAA